MSLVALVITLIVIGVLMWLVNAYIPMQPPFKQIVNVVVIIAVVLWLLYAFGVMGDIGNVQVPRLHR
jgi:cation transporter-like permease